MNKKYLVDLSKMVSCDYDKECIDVDIDDINDVNLLKDILKGFYYGMDKIEISVDQEMQQEMSKETREWLCEYKKSL